MCIQDILRATFKLNTLVDEIFGGKCINTIICRECLHVSYQSNWGVITYTLGIYVNEKSLLDYIFPEQLFGDIFKKNLNYYLWSCLM